MKKSLMGVILASVILFGPNNVLASSSCSYSEQAELNNISANVKATYEIEEIKTETLPDPDDIDDVIEIYEKKVKVNILNVTDEIYIKVTNNQNDETLMFYSRDARNGIISFYQNQVDTIVNYTIEVYANKYKCAGELYKKLTLTTPMYNDYSELEACSNNPDFYYCQEYITTSQISYSEFFEKVQKYEKKEEEKKQEQENSFWENLKEFYRDNKIVINVIGTIVVIGGVTATVILVKKRRSRVL